MAIIDLVGRIALALVFLGSALSKITNFSGTQLFMESKGMPMAALLLVGAIAFETVGGLSVATGYKARFGALLLVVFLVPVTIIFHFDPGNQDQMIQVMKNLAIGGGLLLVTANGAGALSLRPASAAEQEAREL
jgi:uncharacterized membrane protein YphA (DoxX/SURF4 family)